MTFLIGFVVGAALVGMVWLVDSFSRDCTPPVSTCDSCLPTMRDHNCPIHRREG